MSVAVQGEAECMVPIIVCRSEISPRVGTKKGIEIEIEKVRRSIRSLLKRHPY